VFRSSDFSYLSMADARVLAISDPDMSVENQRGEPLARGVVFIVTMTGELKSKHQLEDLLVFDAVAIHAASPGAFGGVPLDSSIVSRLGVKMGLERKSQDGHVLGNCDLTLVASVEYSPLGVVQVPREAAALLQACIKYPHG